MRTTAFRGAGCAALTLVGLVWAAPVAATPDEVLAMERKLLADSCQSIEFLDGYATEVEANGDGLPDYLVNTQRLICDGSQMMFCGSSGCEHRIWVGRPGGGYELAFESLTYTIEFDRPGDPSFLATGRHGAERIRLDAATQSLSDLPVAAPDLAGVPKDRWVFRDTPTPIAAIAGTNESWTPAPQPTVVWVTCGANGDARLGYASEWWMFRDGELRDIVVEWTDPGPMVGTFIFERTEYDVPFVLVRAEEALYAPIAFDDDLLVRLARDNTFGIAFDGEIYSDFTLRGSADALRALRAAYTSRG